jgi:hypothetical protein
MLFFIIVTIVGVVLTDVVISKAFSGRAPIPRTLCLRDISPSTPMVTKVGQEHKNPFTAEFVVVFEYISNILDYAVMKYVADDVRILSRQEGKHAVMHIAAMKQRKEDGMIVTLAL